MDIVTAQEMYEWDRVTIEETGITGDMLMESAGRAVADELKRYIRKEQRIVLLAGAGNNGGDGFVISRTLLNQGYDVELWQVVPDEKISGDAAVHKRIFLKSGYDVHRFDSIEELTSALAKADVVIDAMLGIGVKGSLREPLSQIVEVVNQHRAVKIAIDLPTGVPADESEADFTAFTADYTIVIAAPKVSVFVQKARPYYGEWSVVEIGLPIRKLPDSHKKVWTVEDVQRTLPKRKSDSHKGSHGKGLMVGGSVSMPGSVAMSAKAALRSGAGLMAIATAERAIPSISPYIQEATFVALEHEEGFITGQPSLSGYDGIAAGMGMGRHQQAEELMLHLIQSSVPLLIDADGLYGAKRHLESLKHRETPVVLTPHPGEFAHLTGRSIPEILDHPFSLSRQFAREHGVYLVLKGPATIITAPDGEQRVDISGNSGLAKGGSGDVLSGILLALMMQSDSVLDGLSNGCVIHGMTAEQLTSHQHSTIDLLATDVVEGLTQTFRTLSVSSI
ncbi:NAD(P)H-hydrate dehydratase [Halobacillus fulvus]|nr:NAD(P)H-hydrate dehydratase [Halobacillus fulvus]